MMIKSAPSLAKWMMMSFVGSALALGLAASRPEKKPARSRLKPAGRRARPGRRLRRRKPPRRLALERRARRPARATSPRSGPGRPASLDPCALRRARPEIARTPSSDSHVDPVSDEPLADFEGLLTAEEVARLGARYRPIFACERIRSALRASGRTYPDWERRLQRRLLDAILFYEGNDGASRMYAEGHARADRDGMPDFRLDRAAGGNPVTYMQFVGDGPEFVLISQLAWRLFVEANRKTAWSLADYSTASLAVLFDHDPTQPRLRRQHFVVDVHPAETYAIMSGLDRERWDTTGSLVGATPRETILNVLRFVGERSVHYRGGRHTYYHPEDHDWPYWERNARGDVRMADGAPVPLDRLPTPREILIFRHPHRNRPDSGARARYHIVPGCWGSSKLVQSLLQSVNVPVKLDGDYRDYRGFGGHSGLIFPDVGGRALHVHHSDNLYQPHWMQGLLASTRRHEARERWPLEGFAPLGARVSGYGILHRELSALYGHTFDGALRRLSISPEDGATMLAGLADGFDRAHFRFDRRILAVRASAAPLPVQLLYPFALGLGTSVLPTDYLTVEETEAFGARLQAAVDRRRAARPGAGPAALFAEELARLYRLKTGLDWHGDADGDGLANHRDPYPHQRGDAPDERAWRTACGF